MYPNPVTFLAAPQGAPEVLLAWPAMDGAEGFVVYRSDRAIAPDDTEAFYSGAFGRSVVTYRAARDVTCVIDRPNGAAWYLVLASDTLGNLHAVDLTVDAAGDRLAAATSLQSHEHASVYARLPELIYREDDPHGKLSMYTMAHALGRRDSDS